MATLGQAYVQIMPSAKGISGSIQKAINPEASAAGKSAGNKIASSIAKSMSKTGKTLTKYVTTPAIGAATAVAGVVGALGFKRLSGLDTAQAKLKGLGYSGQEVERISGQVESAIQGGMTTMAEGTAIAAGGLAAGVKEGKELEKYIQLVGDAAIGANRPVDEMAMIFNRVQGGGRLMTQELNMIEEGLPGFAQAMADELAGGSLESFREMVTNGEVGSDEFLAVMDDFAGGMASAHSKSFMGMMANVKNYVAIIGELMGQGLFDKAKEGLSSLEDFLSSEKVQQWATETGESIADFAMNVVDGVLAIKDFWDGLSAPIQNIISKIVLFGGLATVALGPILLMAGKFMSAIMAITPLFKVLGMVIGALTSPIGLIVAAVIGAATLIFIYWQPIKEFFLTMWEAIKQAGLSIWESLKEAWAVSVEFLKGLWSSVSAFFSVLWEGIKLIFSTAWNAIKNVVNIAIIGIKMTIQTVMTAIKVVIQTIWNVIKTIFTTTVAIIRTIVSTGFNLIRTVISNVMNAIRTVISTIWNVIRSVITTVISSIRSVVSTGFNFIRSIITSIMNGIRSVISSVWNGIRSVISSVVNSIRSVVTSVFNAIRSVISSVMSAIRSVISSVWSGILSIISSITSSIRSTISSVFNGLRSIVSGAMNGVKSAVSSGMRGALSVVTGMISNFFNAGKNIVGAIADGIKGAIGKVTDAIGSVAQKARDFLPFSPPKTGPLKDIMDVKWGETIGAGIEDGEGAVAKAMDDILNFELPQRAKFNNPNYTNENDPNSQQTQPIILQVDGKTFAKIIGDYTSEEGGKRIRRIERGLA